MLRLLSISNVGMSVWCILFFGYDIHASGAFVGVSIGLVALSISLFGVLGLILTLFRSFREPSRLEQKSWGLAAMTLLMVVVGLLGFLSPVPLEDLPTRSRAYSIAGPVYAGILLWAAVRRSPESSKTETRDAVVSAR